MGGIPPPEQETKAPNRHIPPEIIEKILLNLPIKSLVRFSCVSTSWKSIIYSPQFVAKHGRTKEKRRVIINENPSCFDVRAAFSSPLSGAPFEDTTSLVYPFRADVIKLKAFCDELWCVVAKKSMYLLNPSTGTNKKLPDAPRLPPPPHQWGQQPPHEPWFRPRCHRGAEVVYGLGYDAVNDDYKLLRISRKSADWRRRKPLLYSLRNDSWREIHHYFPGDFFPESNGLFVNGALHWMPISHDYDREPRLLSALISFDFSTENFRVLQQPEYLPEPDLKNDVVDVAVLKGMLCVFLNYYRSYRDTAFVLWAMQDYGVVESWTKLYEIRYKSIPSIVSEFRGGARFILSPLYLYEDGEVVIWARSDCKDRWEIIFYKDRKVLARKEIGAPIGTKVVTTAGGPSSMVRGGFVYTESFISPAAWAHGDNHR